MAITAIVPSLFIVFLLWRKSIAILRHLRQRVRKFAEIFLNMLLLDGLLRPDFWFMLISEFLIGGICLFFFFRIFLKPFAKNKMEEMKERERRFQEIEDARNKLNNDGQTTN